MRDDLRRRVASLDARDPLSGACPECGLPPKGAKVSYEVVWADDEEAEEAASIPPSCRICGRASVIEVRWPAEDMG